MQSRDIIEVVLSIFLGTGVLIAGIGYLVASYKRGKDEKTDGVVSSADQLVQFWKDQVDGFKNMVAIQDAKIQTLTNELNQVKGQFLEKEKQNKSYLEILQNRNPELEQFMKHMLTATENQAQYQKDSVEIWQKMVGVLDDIHKMSSSNHELLKKEEIKEMEIKGVVTKKNN